LSTNIATSEKKELAEKNSGAMIRTRACWASSMKTTTVLCRPTKKELLLTGPVEAEVPVEVDTLAGGAGVDGAVLTPHSVL